jgi:hypothetical protein
LMQLLFTIYDAEHQPFSIGLPWYVQARDHLSTNFTPLC